MKKEKKAYVLSIWNYDFGNVDYFFYNSRKDVYFNRPYNKTYAKAKKVYGFNWKFYDFWPNCVIDCYDSIDSFNCGKDPVYTKTYYK
jgi:hypothetical protein